MCGILFQLSDQPESVNVDFIRVFYEICFLLLI